MGRVWERISWVLLDWALSGRHKHQCIEGFLSVEFTAAGRREAIIWAERRAREIGSWLKQHKEVKAHVGSDSPGDMLANQATKSSRPLALSLSLSFCLSLSLYIKKKKNFI